jgi:hypothetical protein
MHAKKGVKSAGRAASVTLMTNENFVISPEMVDTDQMDAGVEGIFNAGASTEEGISGRKSIDTTFENTSQDWVDNPRSATTEAPECHVGPLYPHRNL